MHMCLQPTLKWPTATLTQRNSASGGLEMGFLALATKFV